MSQYTSSASVGSYIMLYIGCTSGDLRLQVHSQINQTITGSVQYCSEGEWSEVCRPGLRSCGSTDEWGVNAASVACRQLGYVGQGDLFAFKYFVECINDLLDI